MPLRVLTIQHEDDCPPARVTAWADAAGVDLNVRRPYAGDRLPDDVTGHAGLVVLGGEMGAYDTSRYTWLGPTQRLIADAVVRETLFLGICLGHQLAAVALGGAVSLRPQGPGSGVMPVAPTAALSQDPVMSALPKGCVTVEWNNDIVSELPTGAVVLSHDEAGHPQIVRYAANAWGVQCHPEVTAEVFDSWVAGKPLPTHIADAERLAEITTEVHRAIPRLEHDWTPAMTSFFGRARDRS